MRRSRQPLLAAALAATISLGSATPSAADDPPWVKDWTVLLPEFATVIGACISAVRAKAEWKDTHWIRRAGPMNRGLGLVALQTADGKILECAADLQTGRIQRLEVSGDAKWAEAGGKALYVVAPLAMDGTCNPKPVAQGDWIGWLVERTC